MTEVSGAAELQIVLFVTITPLSLVKRHWRHLWFASICQGKKIVKHKV
jgi:hypothetical protein